MSELKLCQGTSCHQYTTQDRLKGTKGNKTFQTRRRSNLLFDEFCSQHCTHDWIAQYITRAIDHYGRTTEAKHLTEQNAWQKTYDWTSNNEMVYIYRNGITKEQRPLTEEQYRDNNYTLNTGE